MFEEVRGGMMAAIKREKFMAIQAKGSVVDNGKDVVDAVIDNVLEKLCSPAIPHRWYLHDRDYPSIGCKPCTSDPDMAKKQIGANP